MRGLNFVDLQEQILKGDASPYSFQNEQGVQSALLDAGMGDLHLWHRTIQLPGILIDHLKLKSPNPVTIQTTEETPSTVNLNFTLQGYCDSIFEDLPHQINNLPLKHNLLYVANPAGKHLLKPVKHLEQVHIAFQPEYFQRIFCAEEPSLENLNDNMEKKRSVLLVPHHGNVTLKIQEALTDICNCVMKGSIKKLYLEAKVLEVLTLQLESLHDLSAPCKDADKELFIRIKSYLTEHYLEEITLNSVCRYFGINEFKLKKGFQQHFKTSVIRFLTVLRMQQARQLLEHGGYTLLQVSDLLNYSHPNHFSIAFKKFFGINPSEVRRVKKVF